MAEFTVRTRKFITNPLLGRKQFVVDVLHPGVGSVSKKDLADSLAKMYKVKDARVISLFGFKTQFGGGRSTGFGLIYDTVEKAQAFEPKHRLRRHGLAPEFQAKRRSYKELKNKCKKVRGTAKSKLRSK
ncbi:40S ribosomal protein S24, putative [Perkinsus marinus ATCC 50983]|uniref:40S ribosomal protein S24 n=1 Tax=Perkinsus marinus (strain ATCC 50983 / TXsc) TaxID=423536 RepID=C5KJ89_PERM5|nr:40S ribosomal protein S24, putative [Perkinsus marinus ATCC 50983]XP_002773590.1 40S ribosomal protein S24, putative [Perkinsus marinus ATCC 50983]XP_002776927.1 40S ribosomal protein S24, putative [Perkinsus marinus ATCC 50983]XP_002783595.1 40S ribosomal protein S24, putative [Perkinsus marinus ATCC 50983]EEQ98945.1 40S ribosomal protein S24, putative [Perkinsus marinus ATCC 50983]EER05406.1 40S ribosomal protein S24, putative [Perkinsus marinus ATCC 50983]EER08743.1 40S ribosomal protei|eukprot:XP_002766228.1 40S ribosomal protein S24, putative [Perkinsus marinus ATCC 50983]